MQPNNSNLKEGLEVNDLRRLVVPELSVDEFKSKMGRDEDIVVLSFRVLEKEPALDLVNFIEKGYEWVIDADISAGETDDGEFMVFVEFDRTGELAEQVIQLIDDMLNLTDQKMSDWTVRVKTNPESLPLSKENLIEFVPSSSADYLRRLGSKSLDEMRTAAGIAVTTRAPVNDHTQSIRSLAGIL